VEHPLKIEISRESRLFKTEVLKKPLKLTEKTIGEPPFPKPISKHKRVLKFGSSN
jgi:hypothetical protein